MPAFTAAAVISLSLGIATSTTVFSLIDAAILRPPPFADPHRLVILNITQRTPQEGELRQRWSWPRFQLSDNVSSFQGVASSSNGVVTITGVNDPEPLGIEFVSSRYHEVMRAPFLAGRAFTDKEDALGSASPVVVIGHDVWQRRFGGASDVVGRVLELNGVALAIAGVTARGFGGVSGLAQAWVPATFAPQMTYRDYLTTNQNFITVVARLRAGTTLDAARAELAVAGERIHAAQPSEADTPNDRFSAAAMSLNDARIDVVTRRALMLLAGAVGVLLLIACANVASLLLGRAASRRREMACASPLAPVADGSFGNSSSRAACSRPFPQRCRSVWSPGRCRWCESRPRSRADAISTGLWASFPSRQSTGASWPSAPRSPCAPCCSLAWSRRCGRRALISSVISKRAAAASPQGNGGSDCASSSSRCNWRWR